MGVNFNLGFAQKNPFIHKSASAPTQICINMGDDGTWYGYEYNNFGSATPDEANDGTLLYSFKFNSDGLFILAFGEDGQQLLDNIYKIQIENILGLNRLAQFDETTNNYRFEDIDLANNLINNYSSFCCTIVVAEGLIIDYDYAEIEQG